MLTVCYSPKGGQGCTTVAVLLAAITPGAVLIDIGGDAPDAAGLDIPAASGIGDVLAGDEAITTERLAELTITADPVSIIPAGSAPIRRIEPGRWHSLAAAIPADRAMIVDAGTNTDVAALPADRRIMVVHACYLALRRAVACPVRPDEIVLVADPRRALGQTDAEAALGTRVSAVVPVDPRVARRVDAGRLTADLPNLLTRRLQHLAQPRQIAGR